MLQQRPFFIPFFAMAAGLCVADIYAVSVPLSVLAEVFCCTVLACFLTARYPLIICSASFFFTLGIYSLGPYTHHVEFESNIRNFAAHTPVIVEGLIHSRPTTTPTGSSFIMKVESVVREGVSFPASGSIMLYCAEGEVMPLRGDRIRCSTRITIPRPLGIPGEFDYVRYLKYLGVSATGRVAHSDKLVLVRGCEEDSLLRRMDDVASQLGDFIRASVPDQETSSVLAALLLGDQKRIPSQLNDAYTRAGVNHILSISGFHVGIIAYFIAMVALLMLTRIEFLALHLDLRRFVLLIPVPAMMAYLFLTGAAPATARSVIMLAVFVIALYAQRESDPINALLLAAFLLVVLNPPSLFDLSFQLSFIALWGIVIVTPAVTRRTGHLKSSWQRSLIQFIAASSAASCATLVPVLFFFHQASFNGIAANFLLVPILGYGVVLAGFTALPFVYIFPPIAHLLLWCAAKLTVISNWLVASFATLPVISFHSITRLDMFLFISFMCLVTFARHSRVTLAAGALLPSMAVILHLAAPTAEDGRLHITMLSVGQGESMLIRLPHGETMLVDGGGYLHDIGRDFGQRTLGPALFKLGVQRIDRLVLTHSHPDHIGGFQFIARNFPVGEFWDTASGGVGEQYDQLLDILSKNQVSARHLSAGNELTFTDGVKIAVLSPSAKNEYRTMNSQDMDLNEESMVFRLSYGSFSMLFTGDAGFPAEEQILADKKNIASTVLKIGHHGSRFSSSEEFLDRVKPKAALISAGYNNSFGLPAPGTLEQLNRRGIRTYRTDHDGTIEIISDGSSWNIATPWRP